MKKVYITTDLNSRNSTNLRYLNFIIDNMKDEDIVILDTNNSGQWADWTHIFGNTPPPNVGIADTTIGGPYGNQILYSNLYVMNKNRTALISELMNSEALAEIKKHFPYFNSPKKYLCDTLGIVSEITHNDPLYTNAYNTIDLAKANCRPTVFPLKYICKDGKVIEVKNTEANYATAYKSLQEAQSNCKSNTMWYLVAAAIGIFLFLKK